MKMAERMARAILQSRFYDGEPEMYPGGLGEFFDTMGEDNWAEARFEAYAALREAREPSEAMIEAGRIPTREIDLGNGTTATGLGLGADPESIWKRMIDAALSET